MPARQAKWALCVIAAVGLFVVGCGKGERVQPVQRNPREELTKVLQQIAAGELKQVGSAMGEVMNLIEQIKKTDPALGASLEADGKKIMSTQNLNAVKATAQEMLQKLGAGAATGGGAAGTGGEASAAQ